MLQEQNCYLQGARHGLLKSRGKNGFRLAKFFRVCWYFSLLRIELVTDDGKPLQLEYKCNPDWALTENDLC